MDRLWILAAVAVATWIAPAEATGALEVGYAAVEIDNGRPSCSVEVPFCVVDANFEESVGDWRVNASQEIRLIRLRVLPRGDVIPLLPDEGIAIRGSDIYVQNPVFALLTEGPAGAGPLPHEGSPYRTEFTQENITIHFFGASTREPGAPPREHSQTYSYGDNYVQYSQIGPAHEPGGADSDRLTIDIVTMPCFREYVAGCSSVVHPVVNTTFLFTPNVTYGAKFGAVEVAQREHSAPLESGLRRELLNTMNRYKHEPAPPRLPLDAAKPFTLDSAEQGGGSAEPERREAAEGADSSTLTSSIQISTPRNGSRIVILAATASALLLAAVAVFLYTRLSNRDELLISNRRRLIIEVVRGSPGISPAEIARVLNLNRSVVDHHLVMLTRANVLRMAKVSNRVHITLPAPLPVGGVAALGVDTRSKIYRMLLDQPQGLSRADIHAMLPDVPRRTRNYAILTLLKQQDILEVGERSTSIIRVKSTTRQMPRE